MKPYKARLNLEVIDSYIIQGANKLFTKYDVTREQADLSILAVAAWYDMKAKSTNPNEMVIIPQIADWLVHEMISETRAYKSFSNRYGSNLSHQYISDTQHIQATQSNTQINSNSPFVALDHMSISLISNHNMLTSKSDNFLSTKKISDSHSKPLRNSREPANEYGLHREAYQQTLDRLYNEYGIDCEAAGMQESGWDQPAYIFRHPRYKAMQNYVLTNDSKKSLSKVRRNFSDKIKSIKIETWIEKRMVRRFKMSSDAAHLATLLYQLFLENVDLDKSETTAIPEIIASVWFEHVLATQRYREDCNSLFGKFLHKPDFEVIAHEVQSDKIQFYNLYKLLGENLSKDVLKMGWAFPISTNNMKLEI